MSYQTLIALATLGAISYIAPQIFATLIYRDDRLNSVVLNLNIRLRVWWALRFVLALSTVLVAWRLT